MIKLLRAATLGFTAASFLPFGSAFAHHSTAMFKMNVNTVLKGTIKRFDWQNPHTWIVFDVPNGKGGYEEYGIEGMSPNYLVRHGWTSHTLNPGDNVELTIHPLKNGMMGGFNVSVKFANGTVMYNLPHGPNALP